MTISKNPRQNCIKMNGDISWGRQQMKDVIEISNKNCA